MAFYRYIVRIVFDELSGSVILKCQDRMRMIWDGEWYISVFFMRSYEEKASQLFVCPKTVSPDRFNLFEHGWCEALLSWSTNWEHNIMSPWRVHDGVHTSNAANRVTWNRKSYYQLYWFCIWRRYVVPSHPQAWNNAEEGKPVMLPILWVIYLIWQPVFVLTSNVHLL